LLHLLIGRYRQILIYGEIIDEIELIYKCNDHVLVDIMFQENQNGVIYLHLCDLLSERPDHHL